MSIPWPWLLTCGCILAGSIYGIQWLASEGPERSRAGQIVLGLATGWMLIKTFLW